MVKLASQDIGKFSIGTDFEHFTHVDGPLHPTVTNIANLLSLNKKITARGEWYRHLPFEDPAVEECSKDHILSSSRAD
jgi:hypothetical protein